MWLQSCHQKSAAGLACAASTTVKFIDNSPRAQTRPHWQGDWLFYTINDDEYGSVQLFLNLKHKTFGWWLVAINNIHIYLINSSRRMTINYFIFQGDKHHFTS